MDSIVVAGGGLGRATVPAGEWEGRR